MRPGHVYILGSETGTLYIGVTSELSTRIAQHRAGIHSSFAHAYGCHRLLHVEPFHTITEAIAREKQLKGWTRAKKLALIARANPSFKDLAEKLHWPRLGPVQPIPTDLSTHPTAILSEAKGS